MQNMMWDMMGWGPWGVFIMTLFWLALLVLVIVAIVYLVSRITGRSQESPIEILKKRYARGEIDKEEFERMKKDLMG